MQGFQRLCCAGPPAGHQHSTSQVILYYLQPVNVFGGSAVPFTLLRQWLVLVLPKNGKYYDLGVGLASFISIIDVSATNKITLVSVTL